MTIKPAGSLTYGGAYCESECPHFILDGGHNARCNALNQDLEYYDWYLAKCEGYDLDEE